MSEGTQFYYNLSTGAVEEGRQSPGSELMGPYATRQEAERALSLGRSTWREVPPREVPPAGTMDGTMAGTMTLWHAGSSERSGFEKRRGWPRP